MPDTKELTDRLVANVENVIVGKTEAIRSTVIGLLCQGHILIEDVPGTGKTMLAKSLARSIGCSFNRIQFTPDMLPSDVTGVSVFNQKTGEFEYRPGPIMAQIVLTDEVNRATPKTQSALLAAQRAVRTVRASAEMKRYVVDVVTATRRHGDVYVGASPRGSLALFRTAQARAATSGRGYIVPDDVKAMAVPSLAHRMIVGSAARVREVDTRAIVQEILYSLPVPGASLSG